MEIEVIYKNTPIVVEGVYTPSEPMVMYYNDMSGYLGSNSDFEVEDIFIGGISVLELLESDLDNIINLVLEKIEE